MMMAFAIAFTSCAQAKDETNDSGVSKPTCSDTKMTLSDLENVDWLMGTWVEKKECVCEISGSYYESSKTELNLLNQYTNEQLKTEFEAYNTSCANNPEVIDTAAKANSKKVILTSAIETMNNPSKPKTGTTVTQLGTVPTTATSTQTVHLSSDKKVITILVTTKVEATVDGKSMITTYYYKTTYTKQ